MKVLMFSLARRLEEGFIARLTDALTAADLFGTKYAEVDTCLCENSRCGLGYLLQPRIIAGVAAGEVEDFRCLIKLLDA